MRKTKIVATLGPASESESVISALIRAGVDAFRFNFSHGTHEAHGQTFQRVRSLVRESGRAVALIQDLQGPKIRVGPLDGDQMTLEADTEVVLTSRPGTGNGQRVPVMYERLEQEVKPAEVILMDDGKLRLEALSVSGEGVRCRVIQGGMLRPRKGVNFPHTRLSISSFTEKDLIDLRFGMYLGFDAVALSFVSKTQDVNGLRDEMLKMGTVRPVIAKLERAACLDELSAIIAASDAVMVARGDLGVEVDIKHVPFIQKTIIQQANVLGVPVITATQMLESMTEGLLPSRAEAADVANAVLDGTDAVMLSAETSMGKYPVQAVEMMRDIAIEAELYSATHDQELWRRQHLRSTDISEAICHTAVVAAHDIGLQSIVATTRTGRTALDIAKFRPEASVHAMTFDEGTASFLALSRGVVPHLIDFTDEFEGLMNGLDTHLVEDGIASPGEAVAVVMGAPIGEPKSSNVLIIHRVGQKHGR